MPTRLSGPRSHSTQAFASHLTLFFFIVDNLEIETRSLGRLVYMAINIKGIGWLCWSPGSFTAGHIDIRANAWPMTSSYTIVPPSGIDEESCQGQQKKPMSTQWRPLNLLYLCRILEKPESTLRCYIQLFTCVYCVFNALKGRLFCDVTSLDCLTHFFLYI